jgi:hypothetical protein
MPRDFTTHPIKHCAHCGFQLSFGQSYAFHAGFGNCGFLYNDAGDESFIWSSFDPDYIALVGQCHPWMLNEEQRARVEQALLPSPSGGSWRFSNPARCPQCAEPISGPIGQQIMGLAFDRRQALDNQNPPLEFPFRTFLKPNEAI